VTSDRIYVRSTDRMPPGEHWTILTNAGIFVPGDERSRQAHGHGYPEHTESYLDYVAYTDEAAFMAALKAHFARGDKVVGIHVTAERYKPVVDVVVQRS
jgi:hypothetical protein